MKHHVSNTAENKEKKFENDEKEAKALLKERADKVEKEVKEITESGRGRVGNIFRLSKSLYGNKKGYSEPQAVKDPESGNLIVSQKEIKSTVLEYCRKTLENNAPDDDMKEEVKVKELLHELRIKKSEDEEPDSKMNEELFEQVIKKFKKNNK